MLFLMMKMEILEWVIQQVSQRLLIVKSTREEENFRELNSDNTGGITVGEAMGACSRGIDGILEWVIQQVSQRLLIVKLTREEENFRELNSDNTGGITVGEAMGACSRGIDVERVLDVVKSFGMNSMKWGE
nr:hypothetical protein [Tanacetum cinerariifolium]